jgi:hypothetical protein
MYTDNLISYFTEKRTTSLIYSWIVSLTIPNNGYNVFILAHRPLKGRSLQAHYGLTSLLPMMYAHVAESYMITARQM